MNNTGIQYKQEHVFFEVLCLIENKNPAFWVLDEGITDLLINEGYINSNCEENCDYEFIKILPKGRLLMQQWRALNN